MLYTQKTDYGSKCLIELAVEMLQCREILRAAQPRRWRWEGAAIGGGGGGVVVVDWEGRSGRSAEQASGKLSEEARTYLRSGPGARRQVPPGRRRATASCKIYKKTV